MTHGLYRLDEFKDNCGFGLIAHLKGAASHELLQSGIRALTCMTHRGGIAADGKTGDGCGLLIQKPDAFLRDEARELFGIELPEQYAVGTTMLHTAGAQRDRARAVLNEELKRQGLVVAGWRVVPTDSACLGEIALASLPVIEQVFVTTDTLDEAHFNARLLVARRKAEQRLSGDEYFHITSLSTGVLSYKGLMMPVDLPRFYLDLADPRVATAICVFHQRFSTNTMPRWPLAQPFRLLAHNGEINTITANRNWALAREPKFQSHLIPETAELSPLVNRTGSDSSSLDNMLELLLVGGMELHKAIRILVPPAWHNVEDMSADEKAFFDYHSMHMEPWDGPAGLVITDGRYAVCALDRNGLRPSRWVLTRGDVLAVASEVGVCDFSDDEVVAKGRLGPGDILSIDTREGRILGTADVQAQLCNGKPYKRWLRENMLSVESTMEADSIEIEGTLSRDQIRRYMKMYQVSFEERDQILRPLAETGQEAVGSMGDDTPMAVLSRTHRNLFDYFRQQFAQVTNPPIDPLREAVVMSLSTQLGPELNVFGEGPEYGQRINLSSPVLSPRKYFALKNNSTFRSERFDLQYDPQRCSLREAIEALCRRVEDAIRRGIVLWILSDSRVDPGHVTIHSALAVGAVHHHLIRRGLRCEGNIIASTGYARDAHHIAVLLGYGASAVYPYLSYHLLCDLIDSGELIADVSDAFKQYRKGINKGLMKVMSKMGISTVASYRGAQLFEIVGLASDVVELCFCDTPSRIGGATFADIEAEQRELVRLADNPRKPIRPGGLLKYVHGQEYHAYNPDVVELLQRAVQSGDYNAWLAYAEQVNHRPVATLRDLLQVRTTGLKPIPLVDVEPFDAIVKRFDSAGMSLGALSPEAHEALAEAMNRLGGRSNSGEGGEDPARYGTLKSSKIKQVASGRFGVTPAYLVNAEVLQIKIAQGAKPGEGGQLPGGKVNELIARLRYSVPGVTLISPPPHHDIYSIEDLAQLIFDLKQVNPEALVSVKLVSRPGVGTIAAGVAKAYADLITISGYDGGTAASPLSSIRYAGSPWELGLSETHQTLRANRLRHKVRIQTDGGLKTGLDVIKAAILGAESFGFGTAPMVALGCRYLRICHLNNCATGVATQDRTLRDHHYHGTVEMAMNFFRFVAEETREWLARLGIARLEDLVGRVDLLEMLPGETARQQGLDLGRLLHSDDFLADKPQTCQEPRNEPFDRAELSRKMVADTLPSIRARSGGTFSYTVCNSDRSIGARLSGEIARLHGNQGMADAPIRLQLKGVAGQSLGVWNAGGLEIYLEGDANDYVGKGMAGGKIVLRPPQGSVYESREATILGNTCLYGATGGKLFASGQAGERFAVRNSGAYAVVEGAGDHCCEYMTGGVVTVLGATGANFGAGMTGGFAFVLDLERTFVDRCNMELVEFTRINSESLEAYRHFLKGMIAEFVAETDSAWGRDLLDNFSDYVSRFWLVKPKAANLAHLLENTRARPE